ncbi:MAG TPA: hypothetical protein VFZ89_14870 [Solirubrobacteraceae bacterium]
MSLLSATGLLAAAPASQAVTYGISDQQAATFVNPLYRPLNLKVARYVIPYDVMSDKTQLDRWDAWHKAARAANQRILISIEHSRTHGKEQQTPTLAQYELATKAFRTAYPDVKEINTWNEVNACQKGARTERQPRGICRPSKARLLDQFYASNRKVFRGATIIPMDVLDDRATSASSAVAYIKAFKKVTKKMPTIWGVHNYSDTNRFSDTRLKKILKAIGPKGKIWLLETGGQLNVFGGTLAKKEAGAAKALKCMFYIANKYRSRVQRNYIYQFNGAVPGATFDAGLIDHQNNKRPGYTVVQKRQRAKC